MRFIKKSLKLSYELQPSRNEKFSHFCFMFDKNNLISIGLNNSSKENAKVKYFGDRFNVEQFKKFHYPHAEIDCISKAWSKYHITGKERLVVIRIGKAGDLLNSLPCSNCKTVLSALGFSSVWHSISGDVIESKL